MTRLLFMLAFGFLVSCGPNNDGAGVDTALEPDITPYEYLIQQVGNRGQAKDDIEWWCFLTGGGEKSGTPLNPSEGLLAEIGSGTLQDACEKLGFGAWWEFGDGEFYKPPGEGKPGLFCSSLETDFRPECWESAIDSRPRTHNEMTAPTDLDSCVNSPAWTEILDECTQCGIQNDCTNAAEFCSHRVSYTCHALVASSDQSNLVNPQ